MSCGAGVLLPGDLVEPAHILSLSVEVSHNPAVFIQNQKVPRFPPQLAYKFAMAFFRGETQGHDAVARDLFDVVYPSSLEMGSKELAEGRRAVRVSC